MRQRHGNPVAWFALAAVMSVGLAMLAPLSTAVAQDSPKTITIALNEYKGSGVSGWATLTANGKGVDVQMAVEGKAVTGNQPTHIHTGTCDNFDPSPMYPLTTFVLDPLTSDGVSQSNVPNISLDKLLAGDYVILVHKSPEELTTYFICGEIKESNAVPPPAAGAAGTVSMSATGAGTTASDSRDNREFFALAFVALALGFMSMRLRRQSRVG
jgi:hypothetical protein